MSHHSTSTGHKLIRLVLNQSGIRLLTACAVAPLHLPSPSVLLLWWIPQRGVSISSGRSSAAHYCEVNYVMFVLLAHG